MPTTYDYIAANKRRSIALIAVFIIVIGLVGWVFSQILEAGSVGLVFAVVIAVVMSLVGYYSGDRIALFTGNKHFYKIFIS
jgi:heat shock protein HtpX